MKTDGKYILVNKKPVAVDDLYEWANWYETADRIVAQDNVGEVFVSTVFLGVDHSFPDNPARPLLFETMIFNGEHDQYQRRCSTWNQALKMHKKALELVNNG